MGTRTDDEILIVNAPQPPNPPTPGGAPLANLEILGAALQKACLELLSDYGLAGSIEDAALLSDPPTSSYLGVVDFEGNELRGRVLLSASQQVIEKTAHAAPGMHGHVSTLSDWTCELTNQLIGRVKNKLRPYNVVMEVSSPRLISRRTVLPTGPVIRYRFRCDGGSFSGILEVTIAPGLILSEHPSDQALPEEGELIFL